MKRKLSTFVAAMVVAVAVTAPASAGAHAKLPRGFVGVSTQNPNSSEDLMLMREAGVRSIRLGLNWGEVEADNPEYFPPDWAGFDREVELAAEAGIRVMPTVLGSPDWIADEPTDLPVRTAWQRRGWTRFLRAAVRRYGPHGQFWEQHRDLRYLPIRDWEVWNEENIVSFATEPDPAEFARLVRISGRALHVADHRAKAIVGGLFGRPLQVPPNAAIGEFLNGLYRSGNVKRYFDGVGLHPYVANAGAMRWQLRLLRRIMRRHHDARTPIYVTELGWGSRSGPTRWERGLHGQARQLSKAFRILAANRVRWRIAGAWWFSWRDGPPGSCLFCTTSGLLTTDREAKPSWYRFNSWTGGDPRTVPRAKFGK